MTSNHYLFVLLSNKVQEAEQINIPCYQLMLLCPISYELWAYYYD